MAAKVRKRKPRGEGPVAFPTHSSCTKCRLHEAANRVGIPTERIPESLWPGPAVPALIVCGQNPGYHEDKNGCFFVGRSGELLRGVYLDGIGALGLASVYLTNACRCGPESCTTPGPYNACIPYTAADIDAIADLHRDAPVALLFVSAPAVRSYTRLKLSFPGHKDKGWSQKESFAHQGRRFGHGTYDTAVMVAMFSSYHPAYIMRGNDAQIQTVEAHLELVRRYLVGDEVKPAKVSLTPAGPPPTLGE